MFRALVYIGLGWLLAAAVPGFASVLALTVMLPSTTTILLVHLAFAGPRESLVYGLGVALALGYLEDLHQGAPSGTLMLAHAITYIGLHRVALRIALPGLVSRMIGAAVAVLTLDGITWAVLSILATAYEFDRAALNAALPDVGWHALATALATYPVWFLIDSTVTLLRVRGVWPEPRPERMR